MPETNLIGNAKHTTAPNDPIAVAAYLDWIAAGKPSGRDDEFWLKAEDRISNGGAKSAKTSARKAQNGRAK